MLTEQEKLKKKYEYNIEHGYMLYNAYKCICGVCGTTFYSKLARAKYCSSKCRNDSYIMRRKERHEQALYKVCAVCGKQFKAKRKDTLYCSCACKQAAYRKNHVTDISSSEFCKTMSSNKTVTVLCCDSAVTT